MPTLSIFDEVDRKISKSNGTSYLFYFTKPIFDKLIQTTTAVDTY